MDKDELFDILTSYFIMGFMLGVLATALLWM
jgi:hypothetical protein